MWLLEAKIMRYKGLNIRTDCSNYKFIVKLLVAFFAVYKKMIFSLFHRQLAKDMIS